ncbi:MAG: SCO1664 family protein [Candidatus Limnocylindrales bacterium]
MSDRAAGGPPSSPETASFRLLEVDRATRLAALSGGRLELVGRISTASNASFYAVLEAPDAVDGGEPLSVACVYKPTRGERPLDDFPDGTLAFREVAAYVVSEATGWSIVPPTVLREGPFGPGMVQLWLDPDEGIDPVALIRSGAPALRRMALFDVLVNNADRKVGHLLPMAGGHVYGVDHGICFAVEPKLRTVLWGWRGEPLTREERATLQHVATALGAELGDELRGLLSRAEVRATRARITALLAEGCFPQPDPYRPVIPWPPY